MATKKAEPARKSAASRGEGTTRRSTSKRRTGGEESAARKRAPSAEQEEPSAEQEEPSAEQEEPSAEQEEPSAEEEEPSAEEEGRGPGEIAKRAARQLLELTGRAAEGVTALERTDEGWRVEIEVLETRRIPDTTDMLAVYAVEVDGDGNLLGYSRTRRYVRGREDGEAR